MKKILTEFKKGIKNSKALSFSLSAEGAKNCDAQCRMYNSGGS